MLKGKSIIELTDVHTGKKEIYEDENLVTEAIFDVLNTNIQGTMYDNPYFDSQSGEAWLLPIYQRITGGVLLYQDEIEEDPATIYAPLDNPLIGYASNDANNTEDVQRGSRNLTESKAIDGGFKYVWDFATSQANGTISCICLTNVLAGRGCKYADNYFVRLKSDNVINGEIDNNSYRHNHRTYMGEGYRLELVAVHNSMSVTLRKVLEDYIHARLMVRTYTQMATEADEETYIELSHYPYWTHYSGGSRDGEDTPYWNDETRMDYLFHAADGNWYGIARKEIRTYTGISYGSERYDRTGFEWFLDKISGDKCTTQKIILPTGTTDISNIGMSGKWLMFAIGSTIYRLDTTNVANLEVVPNASYNSSHQFTFCVDDEVVINGWYYHDGKPALYVRAKQSDTNGETWGQRTISRYKTYAFHEYYYSSYGYHFRKELYLYTPYLATINNLATPVIKTADKTMKVTYTLTETEEA